MAFYRTCHYCGANLDPGEHCDCKEAETLEPTATEIRIEIEVKSQNTETDGTSSAMERLQHMYGEASVQEVFDMIQNIRNGRPIHAAKRT